MCAHTIYHAKFYIHELITTFETQTQNIPMQKHAQVWMLLMFHIHFLCLCQHPFLFIYNCVPVYSGQLNALSIKMDT